MKTPHNAFKAAITNGQDQYGYWLGLCNPISAEILGLCGYDWLLIDAEHAPNDLRTVREQLVAIGNTPSHPVVRIVEANTALIKQMLDLGVQSLLVPMVETAAQAEQLVRAVRYPPAGVRGVGTALARASRWNNVEGYFADADSQMCLLIQVESITDMQNLDEILSVEGIDGVFFGPADLAASMGYLGQPAHPEVVSVMEDGIRRTRAAGKAAGTLATNKTVARNYQSCGVNFVALGVDTLAIAAAARATLAEHLDASNHKPDAGNGAY